MTSSTGPWLTPRAQRDDALEAVVGLHQAGVLFVGLRVPPDALKGLVLGAVQGAGTVPAMPRRDEPPLSPEQALALARDVLDGDISQDQALAIIKALRVSARLCRHRQPIAAANHHMLAVALLVEFKRRARLQPSPPSSTGTSRP